MKKLFIHLVLLSSLLMPMLIFSNAAAFNPFQAACSGEGSQSSACQQDGSNPVSGQDGILVRAAQIVAIVTGVAAVIIIIIGGIQFVLAGGDSSKVASARNTIIYALIGLVVAIAAQSIITFVLNRL